jgi:hypothetical protein
VPPASWPECAKQSTGKKKATSSNPWREKNVLARKLSPWFIVQNVRTTEQFAEYLRDEDFHVDITVWTRILEVLGSKLGHGTDSLHSLLLVVFFTPSSQIWEWYRYQNMSVSFQTPTISL